MSGWGGGGGLRLKERDTKGQCRRRLQDRLVRVGEAVWEEEAADKKLLQPRLWLEGA